MIQSLFPITSNWSWGTFVLYAGIGIIVCLCCKKGAQYNENHLQKNAAFNIWYFCAFFLLVMLATLRTDQVGPDTDVYVQYFLSDRKYVFDWSNLFDFKQMEPGFQLYLFLISRITNNYHIFFFITYSFVAFAYVSYIKYFYHAASNYIFLQLFIYFYVSNMSGMRAALGTFFLLFSFIEMEKNKNLNAVLLTLLAAAFHYTMLYNLFMIAAVWVFYHKGLRKKKWLWIIMIIAITLFAGSSVSLLKSLFASTKYDYYSSVSIEDQSLLGSMIFVVYGVVCFINYKYFSQENCNKKRQFILTLCFLVTYPILYITMAYRIPNYYAMPRLAIWSDATKALDDAASQERKQYLVNFLVQTLVIVYLLFRFTRSSTDGSFAYQVG